MVGKWSGKQELLMLLMPPGKGSRDQRDQRCSGPRYIYKTVVNVSSQQGILHFIEKRFRLESTIGPQKLNKRSQSCVVT